MIKLIIFDLDGVLVDSCDTHYESLNYALEKHNFENLKINYKDHLEEYNGKPTYQKLDLLAKKKGLNRNDFQKIWETKQQKTLEIIMNYEKDERICNILKQLKSDGYIIYVASNSIWNTLKTILYKKGFLDYIDFFISNEEVKHPKPESEIYFKCFERAKLSPKQCIILEDSLIGKLAAKKSGAHLLEIKDCEDVTYKKINMFIKKINTQNLTLERSINQKKLNIVIPMAGNGSRFANVGYTFPKPLIEVNGKPMIQVIVENLGYKGDNIKYIFIVRKEHLEKYNLKFFLNAIAPDCKIISIDKITEGAACTVLKAIDYINNDNNLIIANSDQYVEWSDNIFLDLDNIDDSIDGVISTFESVHPKWSFAKVDENGKVLEVAEKNPISNNATTGIYFWKRGLDFVKYANLMISKNIRVNNEFYVCPVFNEAILDNKKFIIKNCKKMWGLGTPEDLNYYLKYN